MSGRCLIPQPSPSPTRGNPNRRGPAIALELEVSTADDDAVAVAYEDLLGGSRRVRHAALAGVDLTLHRSDHRDVTMSTGKGVFEYGTRQGMDDIEVAPLPAGWLTRLAIRVGPTRSGHDHEFMAG